MRVSAYIKPPVGSLLDVGCNIGAWLRDCSALYPSARLAGVDVNRSSIDTARANVPRAEFHVSGAEHLPFSDSSFDYVTCTEVIEHLPTDLRSAAFREMRRVLRPSGRLILTVPHAGWFAWLDSNNARLRLPRLYRWVIGRGMRDAAYDEIRRPVTWHYHFTVTELMELAGEGWRTIGLERGGLFVFPLMDWLSWPFYKVGRADHPVRRTFERIAGWDTSIDYGRASWGVLLALERVGDRPASDGSGAFPA